MKIWVYFTWYIAIPPKWNLMITFWRLLLPCTFLTFCHILLQIAADLPGWFYKLIFLHIVALWEHKYYVSKPVLEYIVTVTDGISSANSIFASQWRVGIRDLSRQCGSTLYKILWLSSLSQVDAIVFGIWFKENVSLVYHPLSFSYW